VFGGPAGRLVRERRDYPGSGGYVNDACLFVGVVYGAGSPVGRQLGAVRGHLACAARAAVGAVSELLRVHVAGLTRAGAAYIFVLERALRDPGFLG
jgi:hypothetical protein